MTLFYLLLIFNFLASRYILQIEGLKPGVNTLHGPFTPELPNLRDIVLSVEIQRNVVDGLLPERGNNNI